MPTKQLTQTEWNLVVRILADVEHLLHCLHGGTVTWNAPTASGREEALRLNLIQEIRQLARAQRLVGFRPDSQPYPPETAETYVQEAVHHLDA